MIHFAFIGLPGLHEILITIFLFLSAPVSAYLLAKAALHLHLESVAPPPQDKDRPS